MSKRRKTNKGDVIFRAGGAEYRKVVDLLRERNCSDLAPDAVHDLLREALCIGLQAKRAQLAAQQKDAPCEWVLVPKHVLELVTRQAGEAAVLHGGGCDLAWFEQWCLRVLQDMACVLGYAAAAEAIDQLHAMGSKCRPTTWHPEAQTQTERCMQTLTEGRG